MTWVRVSQSEFDRIRKLIAERKAKREEKRKTLPHGSHRPEELVDPKERKKRRKKTPRQIQIEKNDNLASLAARRRDLLKYGPLCRMCGKAKDLVGYHVVSKKRSMAIRWLLENIIAACASCNFGEMMNRSAYRDKHIVLLGKDVVEAIEARARGGADFSMPDLVEIGRWLKAVIETAPGLPEPPRPSCLPAIITIAT